MLRLGGGVGLLVWAVACVGEDPVASSPEPSDAGAAVAPDGGTAATGDAAALGDSGSCDLGKPFEGVHLVPGLATPSPERGGKTTSDELFIYDTRPRGADGAAARYEIHEATRPTRFDPFGPPNVVPGVSSLVDSDVSPFVTDDRLLILFASSRDLDSSSDYDLWLGSRPTPASPFGDVRRVTEVATRYVERGPFLTANGARLWFSSNRPSSPGGGRLDLYVAPRGGLSFGEPVAERGLNTPDHEDLPVLSPDELTIFFSSDRRGSMDLWMARRDSLDSPWKPPASLDELNGSSEEEMGSVSPDGCRIYFASDRSGNFEIYVAERPR